MISIDHFLSFVFKRGVHDGLFITDFPEIISACQSAPDKCVVEFCPNGCIRLWSISGYEEYKNFIHPAEKKADLEKRMLAAIDSGDFETAIKLRKELKSL